MLWIKNLNPRAHDVFLWFVSRPRATPPKPHKITRHILVGASQDMQVVRPSYAIRGEDRHVQGMRGYMANLVAHDDRSEHAVVAIRVTKVPLHCVGWALMQQASPRAHSRATWPRTLEPTYGARDQAKESTVKLTPWLGNGLHGLGRGSMALAVERGVRGQRQTRDRFELLTTIEHPVYLCIQSTTM